MGARNGGEDVATVRLGMDKGKAMDKVKRSVRGEVWVLRNDKDDEGMECFECGKMIGVGDRVVWCRVCYGSKGVCVAHEGCGLRCGAA